MDRTERPGLAPAAAVLLVGAPVVMVLGRLLLVPFDDQGWDGVLTQAAAHQNSSDAGWLLAIAASGLLGAATLSLANVLRLAGRTKAAVFATVATALGWAGAAGISTGGLLLSYQGKAPDRAVQVQLLKDFNAGHSAFVFLLCVLAAVGYVVLAVGLAIALGGAGTLLTGPGPLKPLLVFAALVLLAGHVLFVRAVGVETTSAPKPVWEPVSD